MYLLSQTFRDIVFDMSVNSFNKIYFVCDKKSNNFLVYTSHLTLWIRGAAAHSKLDDDFFQCPVLRSWLYIHVSAAAYTTSS